MEKTYFLHKSCLIIGNGFDMELGLPTSYSDFLKSEQFSKILSSSKSENSLLNYIHLQYANNNWCDLEEILYKYAFSIDCHSLNETKINAIRNEYDALIEALEKFLTNAVRNTPINCKSVAAKVLIPLLQMRCDIDIFSFNYTPLDSFCEYVYMTCSPRIFYIHGTLKNKNIILGTECGKNKIPRSLSFLLKTNNPNYESTHLLKHIEQTQNIIIFGHSLNRIDKFYFKPIFDVCLKNEKKCCIIIITKDEQSDRDIRDNIREMGIELSILFQKTNLKFIHTSSISNEELELILKAL